MDLYLSQRRPVLKCLSPFGSLSCFFFGCCSSLMFRRSPVRPFQRNFQYVKELFLGCGSGRHDTCNRLVASVGTLNTLSGTRYVGGLSRLFTPCCNPLRGRGSLAPGRRSLLSCPMVGLTLARVRLSSLRELQSP